MSHIWSTALCFYRTFTPFGRLQMIKLLNYKRYPSLSALPKPPYRCIIYEIETPGII